MVKRINSNTKKTTSRRSRTKKKRTPASKRNKKNIIPNVKSYLPHLINRNFEDDTLRHQSTEPLHSLVSTGDLIHLRRLATIEPLYLEKAFWKQILEWKILAYHIRYFENDKDNIPEHLLNMVVEGFKRAIFTYKYTKLGRPSKLLPIDFDIIGEYKKIDRELLDNLINNEDLKILRDLESNKTINRKWAREHIQVIKDKRKESLKRVIESKNIKFNLKQLERLSHRTNANISYFVLAKQSNLAIRKVKEQLARQDEYIDNRINLDRFEEVIHIQLPGGEIVSFDWIKFDKAHNDASQNYKDQATYFETLSEKLKVPIEAIETFFTNGGILGYRKLRTPHLPRSRSKSKKPTK